MPPTGNTPVASAASCTASTNAWTSRCSSRFAEYSIMTCGKCASPGGRRCTIIRNAIALYGRGCRMFLDALPAVAQDPILGLAAVFERDSSPAKVDLGIGVYRDG